MHKDCEYSESAPPSTTDLQIRVQELENMVARLSHVTSPSSASNSASFSNTGTAADGDSISHAAYMQYIFLESDVSEFCAIPTANPSPHVPTEVSEMLTGTEIDSIVSGYIS